MANIKPLLSLLTKPDHIADAPGKPIDVHVVDIGSRSAKVSWLPPTDEQNLPLQYNVQYKRESGILNVFFY